MRELIDIVEGAEFSTPWEYVKSVNQDGNTFHLWKAKHTQGYTAYQVTRQPRDADAYARGTVKPRGTDHYISLAALKSKTGIDFA